MTTDRSLIELAALDRVFADFICRLAGRRHPGLWLGAAFASSAAGNGSICAELGSLAGEVATAAATAAGFGEDQASCLLDAAQWGRELAQYDVVTAPGGFAPLVLDAGNRLYLHRYWGYEQALADRLLAMATESRDGIDDKRLRNELAALFPSSPDATEPDWQRLAAFTAVKRSLTVIAGGPGTGKTTTVVKMLALLLALHQGKELRIAMAAPTGKAAARLMEAVARAMESLSLPEAIRLAIPREAYTLHRLLGYLPGSVSFRHTAENPLLFDVVVVDESSMVDLPLMAKLVAAIKPASRLVLLGDRDQLASVEPGAVLGDICHPYRQNRFSPALHDAYAAVSGITLPDYPAGPVPKLCDSIVTLKKSHRFTESSGIAAVSRLVNEGRGAEALELMKSGDFADITWRELPSPDELPSQLSTVAAQGYGDFLLAEDAASCLDRFGRFRILSPVRQGIYGVQQINTIAERALGLKLRGADGQDWYRYRPVLISRNDYQLGLANGDIGITLNAEAGEGVQVWFPALEGNCRRFSPLVLKGCDTVFAMTVHKSQGSEFDALLVLLPPLPGDVLTRELIYTAITRGRKRVELWGRDQSFIEAVSRRVQRSSGLRERLWG
ncbi:exodeoxyribonuclease V subunit alpha [Geobacter pelophilus]|uniref:Exodeoxyribonuclease V subunit alpha n=1 Tax=Geoanaerobacter pelophilus TaxID=60036 RepID=A0AAW4L9F7_9BACT|nr:exodeoxyribonuclease V subunit alpha [Geoanaerobacter pelophilus]MBT0665693.1 exodeoxyribonuclease V subunit alpha [Geoanaerobacter pelophilus]